MANAVADTLAALNFGSVPSLNETPVEAKLAEATVEKPVDLTDEEKATLYAEAASLKEAAAAINERLDQIKQAYRRMDYGTAVVHKEAQGKVTVGHNPIFNEARFMTQYPYDEVVVQKKVVEEDGVDTIVEEVVYPNRDLYKISADRTAIKDKLTEEARAELFDEGDKKITIK